MGPAADAQLQGNAGQPPMASALDSFPGVTFHFYLFFVIRVAVAGFLPELISIFTVSVEPMSSKFQFLSANYEHANFTAQECHSDSLILSCERTNCMTSCRRDRPARKRPLLLSKDPFE